MAIGDAVIQKMGTAITNYQPSSGVEVQISSFHKQNATDALTIYDGSTSTNFVDNALATTGTSDLATKGWMNCAVMISNAIYLRKTGTTDHVFVTGVQTNA